MLVSRPQNFASRDRCFWDGSRDASEEMDKESHTGIKRLYCRLFFSWLSKTQTSSRPKWTKPSAPIRSRRKYMQPAKSAGKTSAREQIPIEFEPVTENLITGNQFNSEIKFSKLYIDTCLKAKGLGNKWLLLKQVWLKYLNQAIKFLAVPPCAATRHWRRSLFQKQGRNNTNRKDRHKKVLGDLCSVCTIFLGILLNHIAL